MSIYFYSTMSHDSLHVNFSNSNFVAFAKALDLDVDVDNGLCGRIDKPVEVFNKVIELYTGQNPSKSWTSLVSPTVGNDTIISIGRSEDYVLNKLRSLAMLLGAAALNEEVVYFS